MFKSPPILSIYEGNQMFKPFLERFLLGVVDRLRDLSVALESDDPKTLHDATHKLKGSASTFGFPQLSISIAKLEDSLTKDAVQLSPGERVKCFNSLVKQCARLSANGSSIQMDQGMFLLEPKS
jgi:HPt (histidine-containing phosphotransfer) domain-containing protein